MKKQADELSVQAARRSAEADEYRGKWVKMKQQVAAAKSSEREHWERAKKVTSMHCRCCLSLWCGCMLL